MTIELGVFARIFQRPSAPEVASAVAEAGFRLAQLNLSCIGLPTIPLELGQVDLPAIALAFAQAEVAIWGLSASYNMASPDVPRRREETDRAAALVQRAGELKAAFATLCTGSRDPTDMWAPHPGNTTPEAWRAMRESLDVLLTAAQAGGVRLVVEPEPGNVVADARRARRLLEELGNDSAQVGIILDPANLVPLSSIGQQDTVLREAFDLLGQHTVALHAKDVVGPGQYAAAGMGHLDYALVFELYGQLGRPVPVIVQDAAEDDVGRVRAFLLEKSGQALGS